MPQRTNTFQQVVALVHELLAEEGATVEESAMLEDHESGSKREVDVVVRGSLSGVPLLVGIEATASAQPVDVKWVEAELGKHKAVRTNRLVLVSEAGFTAQAKEKALANNAIPVAPEDLTAKDRRDSIVSQLGSVSAVSVGFTPMAAVARVTNPNGETYTTEIYLDTLVVSDKGDELGVISEELRRCLDRTFPRFLQKMSMEDIRRGHEAVVRFGMAGWTDVPDPENLVAGLRWQPNPEEEAEFHRIEEILVEGKAKATLSEVALTHKRLAERIVAYGEAPMFDSTINFIVVDDGSGDSGIVRINAPKP
jgi:hypothetical protein